MKKFVSSQAKICPWVAEDVKATGTFDDVKAPEFWDAGVRVHSSYTDVHTHDEIPEPEVRDRSMHHKISIPSYTYFSTSFTQDIHVSVLNQSDLMSLIRSLPHGDFVLTMLKTKVCCFVPQVW